MYKINSKSISIKFSNNDYQTPEVIEHDVKSLCILLGGYNQYGRNIPIEEYEEVKEVFDQCKMDMSYLLEKYSRNQLIINK